MAPIIAAVIIANFIFFSIWITTEAILDPKDELRSQLYYNCSGIYILGTGLSMLFGMGFLIWKIIMMVIT